MAVMTIIRTRANTATSGKGRGAKKVLWKLKSREETNFRGLDHRVILKDRTIQRQPRPVCAFLSGLSDYLLVLVIGCIKNKGKDSKI
jgi:hypothetical protein